MSNLQEQVLEKIRQTFGDDVHSDFHDEKGDGKHFYLEITSEKFRGKSRIEQSQLVYKTLNEFLKTGSIHALRMKCNIPK
ncbi:BolA family transcriptional regulator [Candidatus Gracilibacteria bacterium]|nr:BolA family transcriptional regulator [Candidatus Gracilibacteria bacterium]